ncbi:phage tail assembly protein [Starkeya sp. ORNL1]|uniref:phage tail assembly protein n=1 Tax=Starkeya sp. ORNL1 TaxID=2709380 RepID=UPI00146281D3|nr:phage tail assembly protein [Starkeya sp. ORNL1]QJP12989.1 phage tail assembly protein [Starkeya sp. ORNL1]
MTTIALQCPVEIDGKQITSVDLRQPTGRGMIELSRHLPALTKLAEQNQAGANVMPDAAVIEALVCVAGVVAGIGSEAAGELAFSDITTIVMASQSFLEPALSAEPKSGGSSLPLSRAS